MEFFHPRDCSRIADVGYMFSLSSTNNDLSFLLQNWTLNVDSSRMKNKHAPQFN